MNEKTLIKTMNLPNGRDWEWFADANVVALAPHLCPEGREQALNEVSAHWRRSCLRVVPTGADDVGLPTKPFDLPRQAAMQPMGQQ